MNWQREFMSHRARQIELLADQAWKAREQCVLGPWKLRFAHGITHRANSVLTVAAAPPDPNTDWTVLIDEAERFYAQRQQPACFQISPATCPADLDHVLDARGYTRDDAAQVWIAASRDAARMTSPATCAVDLHIAGRPDKAWFDCAFDVPRPRRQVLESIVTGIDLPTAFVSAKVGGQVASCAMGVSGGGWTGVFCMKTLPEFRRRNIGAAVVRALADWAMGRGDDQLYLQVMTDNHPAHALYRRCGFRMVYGYHFRSKSMSTAIIS